MIFTIDELIKEATENLTQYVTQRNATQQAFHQINGAIQLIEAQVQHLVNRKQQHALDEAKKAADAEAAAKAAADAITPDAGE